MIQCPKCGADVMEEAIFCHKCGEHLQAIGDAAASEAAPTNTPRPSPAEAFRQMAGNNHADDEPERELWRGGYSGKAMFDGWAFSAVLTIALLVVGIVWVRNGAYWIALVIAMLLPWLYFGMMLCYRHFGVHYLLTDQRFIHEKGILRRVTNRIELLDMDDITFEQGPLERLVGVGTIRIVSSDRTDPNLAMPGIDNVKRIAEMFDDARRLERRRRGLHIEQI